MFILIWVTLLFPVGGISGEFKTFCADEYCIVLKEGEIKAEAGLCAIIPCSFSLGSDFKPTNIIWYKCEPAQQRCSASDVLIHAEINKIQSGFKRVLLLDPKLNQKNCSILINDLTASDSGSYELRVNGLLKGKTDGYTYFARANVSVKDLVQKPTVTVPLLTEGKQTTLTCTAPGLCSGSEPKITWTWRGTGENGSRITGNTTAFKTEKLTAVTLRHSSTLTFTPTTKQHHGTSVTCKVSFTNNITTEETVTLKFPLFPKILRNSGCEIQSEVLTCTCISQGLPLPTINWPLLKNHDDFSVITNVSKHTVSSTITLTVKDHMTTVQCHSTNENGKVQQNINIIKTSKRQEGPVQPCRPDCTVLPWAIAAVSLIVNVICIIYMLIQWNTRKKRKTNQEDRSYTSLRKTDISPEYDVIGQTLN